MRARFCRHEQGNALVEFALAAPVLILIAYGGTEFSRAFNAYLTADQSMRGAVRYLSRVSDPTATWATTAAKNLAKTGTVNGSGSYVIPSASVISNPTVDQTAAGEPFRVKMEAQVPFTSPFLSSLGFSGFTFYIKHQERLIGE